MPNSITSGSVDTFADDTKVFKVINSCDDVSDLQSDLHWLESWADNMGIKDLGVWISDDLSWSKQVSETCSRANETRGFVRRNPKTIRNARIRRTMYLALVRPILGYATQVWAPQMKEQIRQGERIRRRATKFILGLPFRCEQAYKDRTYCHRHTGTSI